MGEAMKNNMLTVGVWVLAVAVLATIWFRPDPAPTVAEAGTVPAATPSLVSPFSPIPQSMQLDVRKVRLGRRLFHEKRLSRDETISCASCHALDKGGADDRAVSLGVGGAEGEVNSPTVFNAVFNFRQYWDGRAADLAEQIDGPLTNPKEMGSSWEHVQSVIASDAEYVSAFDKIYGDTSRESITDAIVEFERSLITPDSDFDRFLRGNRDALSTDAKRGYQLFVDRGCATCHQGRNIGGNMFQTFGNMKDYFAAKDELTKADMGRFNVTGRDADRHKFKVPTLRNIALTAPYLHDGSVKTLAEAVQVMAEHELGTRLSDEDTDLIVVFLRSLTGRLPK